MRHLLLCLSLLFYVSELFPQLKINEISSSNISGLSDEDGDFSDWIELFNNSSAEISLQGYYLSDDRYFLKKWTFPGVMLKPHAYLLVFASDKNRSEIPVNYQTIIPRGVEWEYLVPSSETGNSWQNTGFNSSAWNRGYSGFGYGDNDDSTTLTNIVSVFIRKEFTITGIQDIEELILSIDYDDGFIAYINGHEIARSNLGTDSPVPFDKLTGSLSREATIYQGGFPENFFVGDPQSVLVEGSNVIAIQGHNSASGSSDFSLIPVLSIGKKDNGLNDSVPDYIQLKGRKLHTNFKIKDEGETLILSRPDSTVVDSVPPVMITDNLSYGRKPDGGTTWYYFSVPTPYAPNISKGYSSTDCDTVLFSAMGGYYPGGVELSLSSKYLSDSIFYTIDGSEPSAKTLLYAGPVLISGNMVVRARSLKSERLPGAIFTNTYITRKHTLPVVCLSTDTGNLWDFNTGIYVLGPNASPESPNFGANFWQDWERKAHMELFDISGRKQIDQDIGIKIFGAYSRSLPQKSIALFARKEYGKGSFDYKVFKDKPIEKFESLVLRNGGNDWGQSMMRDGLTSTLVRNMDIDRQAFQPAVVYINGEYWGIHNIREKINSNYINENHFANPSDINLLEFNGNVIEGSNTSYMKIIDYLNSNTLESDQKYKEVSSKIDIDNFIQYQLTQVYINNKDWPGNNVKFWNTNDPGSLWRWILFDTDFGFSIWEESAYTFNTLSFALKPDGTEWPNPAWSTLFFRRMVTNPGFRNEFVDQYADRLNTNFSPEKVSFTVDSIKQVFLPEINDHLLRWNLDYKNWNNNYTIIKNYALYRPSYARDHLRSQFNLGPTLDIRIEIDDPATGSVRINSVVPDKYPFYGKYFKDLPIVLTAIPAPGYKFVKWQMGALVSNSVSIKYSMADARTFKAVFEYSGNSDTRIVINEINYISSPSRDTKDWIELYNAGTATVNLKNWIISDEGPVSGFIFPSDYNFSPGMYVTICRNSDAFRQFQPGVTNITGDMNFGLSSSGDDINLYDPDGNLVDFVSYTTVSPWPSDAVLTGSSIELTDPLSDNNLGKNWKSSLVGGTPGKTNFRTVTPGTPGESKPESCSLTCYPNPFRDYTTVSVEVTISGRYKIEIYNLQGKLLNTIADQTLEAGGYYIDWYGTGSNGNPLPNGIYILRLTGEKQRVNSRVIILK